MKKTRRIKNRIIAGILSAVTIISVGAMSVTSTAAFAIPGIAETVLSTTFGYAKDEVMKLAGPELSKMGLPPILNMVLGLDDNEPTNQDVLDKIDKSTEEIKAEINKVMDEVKDLSTQTSTYHTLQMNQLKAINSNIDTKDFRVQADTVAADSTTLPTRHIRKSSQTPSATSAPCRQTSTRCFASSRVSVPPTTMRTATASSPAI